MSWNQWKETLLVVLICIAVFAFLILWLGGFLGHGGGRFTPYGP